MNTLWIAAFGDPGIFRPAVQEYWQRWLRPMARPDAKAVLDRLLPAQVYVPRRSTDELSRIARVMNESDIPVAFNSFHPRSGMSYLHINNAAKEFLGVEYGRIGQENKYLPIDLESVRGALWLYFYGFDHADNPQGLVDGAYNRQFIISELHMCDRIYVARPQNTRWVGKLPENYFEIQDFITEVWFNNAYAAEVARIEHINKLVLEGALQPPRHRHVELIPVQVCHHYGYFDYFIEQRGVYDSAYQIASQTLSEREFNITSIEAMPETAKLNPATP
ncbi:hypothetical protein CCP2SC5_890010 [Azospirillaceae bacterium]